MGEIFCVARFLAKDGYKQELVNELRLLIPQTIEESGCLSYELTSEIDYPGAFDSSWDVCLIERWRSREDFDAHCNMDYIRNFFDVAAKQFFEKIDVRLYEPFSM